MKLSQKAVNDYLTPMLIPGEEIVCTVYCTYRPISFFSSSSNMLPAAAAITNLGRLFIVTSFLINATGHFVLKTAKKLKIGKNLFGHSLLDFDFPLEKENYRFRLQIAPKVYGCDFPNQKEELQTMLSVLRKYAVG